MKFIVQNILFVFIQQIDFLRVCLEVCPDIVMEWNNDLAVQCFRHTQDIHTCHFVLISCRILPIGA